MEIIFYFWLSHFYVNFYAICVLQLDADDSLLVFVRCLISKELTDLKVTIAGVFFLLIVNIIVEGYFVAISHLCSHFNTVKTTWWLFNIKIITSTHSTLFAIGTNGHWWSLMLLMMMQICISHYSWTAIDRIVRTTTWCTSYWWISNNWNTNDSTITINHHLCRVQHAIGVIVLICLMIVTNIPLQCSPMWSHWW